MKILLAIDGSKYTKKMLAYLSAHTELFSADNDFTVFTAQPALPPRVRAALDAETVASYYADEVEKVLSPACKFLLRHNINAKSDWKPGIAGEAISKFAIAGKFDLIMMGSHGQSALANLVMGSVATQVLAKTTIPVLLVR